MVPFATTLSAFSLPAGARLKKKSDFLRVQNSGRKLYAKHFLIIAAPAEGPLSRIGITITRKVEPRSTRRNLLRRRIREVFRLARPDIRGVWDLIIIARRDSPQCDFVEIRRQLLGTLRRQGIIEAGGEHQEA